MSSVLNVIDFLTRLKNHKIDSSSPCEVKMSNIVVNCIKSLSSIGLITSCNKKSEYLADVFINSSVLGKNPFSHAKSITKPSRKIYMKSHEIYRLQKMNSISFIVVSTSCGVMSAKECIEKGIGGEPLFIVY